ncbi:hypothetical protein EVAR_59469_1 [Eumeta japonica]|uniref:Uncharacterized protein n=1 Tax=Eumeta variegata TaxID=151549 RepID=A0A4C1YVZ6_EUMVA|nr:hypothetical protein EVAR_59469_1 [Eumeta japonica]
MRTYADVYFAADHEDVDEYRKFELTPAQSDARRAHEPSARFTPGKGRAHSRVIGAAAHVEIVTGERTNGGTIKRIRFGS